MMGKDKAIAAKSLDWSEFKGSLPKEGAAYPKGKAKDQLIARMRRAFNRAGVRQVA